MKKKSASRAAFFNLALLFVVVILSVGAFLTLFAASDQRALVPSRVDQLHTQLRCQKKVPSGLSGGVRQEWVASYSGVFDDEPTAIVVDGSGNVYVTGYSGAPDHYFYVTAKYNTLGHEEWVASYSAPNSINFAAAIAVDHSGNVYVTGSSGSFAPPTPDDYATIKYNSAGQQQWVARYNGPEDGADGAAAIAVDGSGNVYVTGGSRGSGTGTDYATIKYDSAGQQQWVARYNGPGNADDDAVAIAVDVLGNVYVTGSSAGAGTGTDYATIKYDNSGQQQWVARYNGPDNGVDQPAGMAIDASGNVYVTGRSSPLRVVSAGVSAYATLKYDTSGQQQWLALYYGPGNVSQATDVGIDGSGNVYVTGTSLASDGISNYATIKYNSAGQQQWVARYTGPDNLGAFATAIAVSSSGNAYVTGQSGTDETGSDYTTVKYDNLGEEQWVARYNGPDNLDDYPSDIAIDRLGNVYVTGASRQSQFQYDWDFATIKYRSDRTPLPRPRPTP